MREGLPITGDMGSLSSDGRSDGVLAQVPRAPGSGEFAAPLSPWSWDVEAGTVWCLPELFEICGVASPALESGPQRTALTFKVQDWLERFSPARRARIQAFMDGVVASGEGGQADHGGQLELTVPVGSSIRWLLLNAAVGEVVEGKVRRVFGYTQDITVQKQLAVSVEQTQQELDHQRQVLERISAGEPLDTTLDLLCRQVERTNPGAFCSVLLHDQEAGVLRHGAAPTLSRDLCAAMDGLQVGEGQGACGTAAARGRVVAIEDLRTDPLAAGAGGVFEDYGLRSVWSYPMRGIGGGVVGTLCLYRSEPHMPAAAEIRSVGAIGNLAALAIERSGIAVAIDATASLYPSTGLASRTDFIEQLDRRLADPLRSTVVLFVEVDRLKYLDDDLGALAGATLLAEVSRRLWSAVGSEALIGRFSGDEFMIAIEASAGHDVRALAERLHEAFSPPVSVRGTELFLLVTVGMAIAHDDADAYGLVRDAAIAMHDVRAHGRGGHRLYSEALRYGGVDPLGREVEIRRAIDFDELTLYYQPVLDLRSDRIDAVEALVRWIHPTRGVLAPVEFIPLAERAGLIQTLGRRVLEIAAAQAGAWGSLVPGLHMAVNVSVLELARPGFADEMLAILDRHGVSPHAFDIDVSESGLVQLLDTVAPVLERLRSLGVRTSIDDFGAGYSPLTSLGALPVSSLKINGNCIWAVTTNAAAHQTVRSIVDIGRAHGLTIVAEGVEDEPTLAAVRELGCDYAQGFHIAGPMPAAETQARLTVRA